MQDVIRCAAVSTIKYDGETQLRVQFTKLENGGDPYTVWGLLPVSGKVVKFSQTVVCFATPHTTKLSASKEMATMTTVFSKPEIAAINADITGRTPTEKKTSKKSTKTTAQVFHAATDAEIAKFNSELLG